MPDQTALSQYIKSAVIQLADVIHYYDHHFVIVVHQPGKTLPVNHSYVIYDFILPQIDNFNVISQISFAYFTIQRLSMEECLSAVAE